MEKPNNKKFTVHYSFYLSDCIEVEASSEREAEQKVEEMICCGELAEDLNRMEVGDSQVWVD